MPAKTESLVVDEKSILAIVELGAAEKRMIKAETPTILAAINRAVPSSKLEQVAEGPNGHARRIAPTSPLYVPGLKLHINLKAVTKHVITASIGLLVKTILLRTISLADGAALVADSIAKVFDQFTRLTPVQLNVLNAICDLRRKKNQPGYAPSTAELAKCLKMKTKEVDGILTPLINQVVRREPNTSRWEIIF